MGTIRAQSDAAFQRLIAHFSQFYAENLFSPHWAEQISLGPDNTLELTMLSQGLDNAQVGSVWQGFFDWINASPQDFVVNSRLWAGAFPARRYWDFSGNPSLVADRRPGAPDYRGWWRGDQDQVGAFLYGFESLWLPASLLSEGERPRLSDALFAASRLKKVYVQFSKGLAGASGEAIASARDTATNPAVTEAFALAVIADGEGPRYSGLARPALDLATARRDAHAIDLATAELRRIAPDGGSYVSESNYFNSSWQDAFWGSNYPRLREVKAKYDPDGLFFVHHGVGSEEWSADGFARR